MAYLDTLRGPVRFARNGLDYADATETFTVFLLSEETALELDRRIIVVLIAVIVRGRLEVLRIS
ncbi:MAG: hypothetical protein QOJ15_10081 [Bradyrhizobium sp.]|nr:hypothetical protein [Bradyrhizobium sp.]